MSDDSPEKYRKWVADNFASDPKEQLFDIYKEAMYENQGDAGRISKTIAKACTLFARLSSDVERVHRSIRCWTISLFSITAVLIGLTVVLIYYTAKLVQNEQKANQNTYQSNKNESQSLVHTN